MMELTHIPKHSERVLGKQVDDTTVLLSLHDGQYYALDEIGSRVWELCDGARSVADVINVIYAEYDAPPETIKTDVMELLDELAVEKMLV